MTKLVQTIIRISKGINQDSMVDILEFLLNIIDLMKEVLLLF
jgi:hypothetical protein